MKILVIENAPAIKNFISQTLDRTKHELIFVSDGNEAWRIIEKRKDIQLVISELNIPGMNGIELSRKIRGTKFPNYIYIMLMTPKTHKADVISGIREGADDILSIPFDSDELQIRVLVGERIIQLEEDLLEKNKKLQIANDISIIGFKWRGNRLN